MFHQLDSVRFSEYHRLLGRRAINDLRQGISFKDGEPARFPGSDMTHLAMTDYFYDLCVPYKLKHRQLRTLGKPFLKRARYWIAQSGEHLLGTRESKDVVPNAIIISIPFNGESFFSALCVFRQGSIGEAKSLHGYFFLDDVDDAAGVQRIEPEMMDGNRHVSSDLYRGTRPMELHPRQVEHLPSMNGFRCPLPGIFAFAKVNTIVVYVVARWRSGGRPSNFWVGEP
jgi:hypothetical protein